jgi:hypothetical protein
VSTSNVRYSHGQRTNSNKSMTNQLSKRYACSFGSVVLIMRLNKNSVPANAESHGPF